MNAFNAYIFTAEGKWELVTIYREETARYSQDELSSIARERRRKKALEYFRSHKAVKEG
jgi:hypothetical protein